MLSCLHSRVSAAIPRLAMQIIEMQHDDWNFHCPVTGRPVYRDDGNPNTPTFRGGWCQGVADEPINVAPELEPSWQAYLQRCRAEDEMVDVRAFLQSIDRPFWVAIEITTSGFCCGPTSDTSWTVLDLSVSVDDVDATWSASTSSPSL